MTKLEWPPLVGETAEQVAEATAKRLQLAPAIERLMNEYLASPRWAASWPKSALAGAAQKMADGITGANRADWWLRHVDGSSDETLNHTVIYLCGNGSPVGSKLPADYFTPEAVAQRKAQADGARAHAAFVGLKPLRGTDKQVAWAETIRAKFMKHCEEQEVDEAFLAVAKSRAAQSAKFWIDHRTYNDFECLIDKHAAA